MRHFSVFRAFCVFAFCAAVVYFVTSPAAYAESEEATLPYSGLVKHGIIMGDDNGNLLSEKDLTRLEMAVILSRLHGVEEEARNFALPSGFADEIAIPAWGKGYASYARLRGWMRGDDFGVFNAGGKISAEECAVLFRRVLGYSGEVQWGENIAALERETGIVVEPKKILKRGEIFSVLWRIVSEPVKSGGNSILETLRSPQ